jgi:hypothetical protein
MRIPDWLGHLRTDRRGLPVPYVNLWGVEDVRRVRMAYDRHTDSQALFQDDEGQEVPDFTQQNMGRQRECMVDGLCQVCRRHVPWSRRFLVVSDMSVQAIHEPKLGDVVAIHEPWLCQRCAVFATDVCPALIRRTREEQLKLIPITSQMDVSMIVSRGWVEGPLEEETKRVQPAMWCKVLLTRTRLEIGRSVESVVAQ